MAERDMGMFLGRKAMRRVMILLAIALVGDACSLTAGERKTPTQQGATATVGKVLAAETNRLKPIGAICHGRKPTRLPKHVFLIVLENEDFDTAFGSAASASSYLKQLTKDGALLSNYYGIGHNSLTNYIAMISGQAPSHSTQTDCPVFVDLSDASEGAEIKGHLELKKHFHEFFGESEGPDYGQWAGIGCVYPDTVQTIADQLDGRWRAYMESMHANCDHPGFNKLDKTRNIPSYTGLYAVRHNPFVYFHSLLKKEGSCGKNDRPLGDTAGTTPGLVRDLKTEEPQPFVFIAPNLCNDGHNDCDGLGTPGKIERINSFLRKWLPIIRQSRAYRDDGMIVITFDEAELSTKLDKTAWGKNEEASKACCHEKRGPGADDPGIFGPGGGKVGAIILSPLVEPGTEIEGELNHYALLKSIEDMLKLPPLGFASATDLNTFQECGVFKEDVR
jgi:phosphatidylinositol-3-phosphatase